MGIVERSVRILRRRPRVWLMIPEALVLSGLYRWQILKRPFEKLSSKIGTFQKETEVKEFDENLIRDVQFSVVGVCNHTPWESKCLVQALTAKKILNRYGLPCTLYMGVCKDEKDEMIAHAWLRCGNIFVTGGIGHLYYTITGMYADV